MSLLFSFPMLLSLTQSLSTKEDIISCLTFPSTAAPATAIANKIKKLFCCCYCQCQCQCHWWRETILLLSFLGQLQQAIHHKPIYDVLSIRIKSSQTTTCCLRIEGVVGIIFNNHTASATANKREKWSNLPLSQLFSFPMPLPLIQTVPTKEEIISF